MIHGKLRCPSCNQELELMATKAPPQQSVSNVSDYNDTDDLGELLDNIGDAELSGATADFVVATRKRYAQYGAKTMMSEKQMAWLKRIAAGEK